MAPPLAGFCRQIQLSDRRCREDGASSSFGTKRDEALPVSPTPPTKTIDLGSIPLFSHLPRERLDALAAALTPICASPETAIFREGDAPDAFYIVADGAVLIHCATASGEARTLGHLQTGATFGEIGVATGARRNATATALVPTLLYALDGELVRQLARSDAQFADSLRQLVHMRARPRRAPAVTEHARGNGGGVVLKSPSGSYFVLGQADAILWRALDGEHTLADLIRLAFRERAGSPDAVLALCQRLEERGFLAGTRVVPALRQPPRRRPLWRRASALLVHYMPIQQVDGLFCSLYRRFGFLFFNRAFLCLAALLVAAGLIGLFSRPPSALRESLSATVLIALFCGGFASMVVHELAHALATKWCGCEVRSVGVGWFWFAPVAFVDTTDAWLAPPRRRVVVSIAGPCANLLIASAAALLACVTKNDLQRFATELSTINYLSAIFNLNPLLKLDGYYVLADLLDRPDLRRQSMQRIGELLRRRTGWRWSELSRHRVELAYGLGSLLYVVYFIRFALWTLRSRLAHRLAGLFGSVGAGWLSWGLGLFMVVLACAGIAAELSDGSANERR
jgi:putative peptide zinc metalloprotease protein